MIDSVHINDSTIYGSSWTASELRPLFAEQNKIKGWLDIMTVLAEVQAEFDLIPEQAAAEIKAAYENLEIARRLGWQTQQTLVNNYNI
jgi:adenylosuccinate lyase